MSSLYYFKRWNGTYLGPQSQNDYEKQKEYKNGHMRNIFDMLVWEEVN
jgi:hypothetical protein